MEVCVSYLFVRPLCVYVRRDNTNILIAINVRSSHILVQSLLQIKFASLNLVAGYLRNVVCAVQSRLLKNYKLGGYFLLRSGFSEAGL